MGVGVSERRKQAFIFFRGVCFTQLYTTCFGVYAHGQATLRLACLCKMRVMRSRLLCPWDPPGKNTCVGSHFLLQGIFLTQGSNPRLLHRQADSLPLSHLESPTHGRPFFILPALPTASISAAPGGLSLPPTSHLHPGRVSTLVGGLCPEPKCPLPPLQLSWVCGQ